MAFAGHAYASESPEDIGAAAEQEGRAVLETAAALAHEGVETPALSVGTTPQHITSNASAVTEIRPGNYVFYDATQVTLGVVPSERCALSVLATVVARPSPHRLILDAGSKALAAEKLTPRSPGYGFVVDHPELIVSRLYEEHAIVTSAEPSRFPSASGWRSCRTTRARQPARANARRRGRRTLADVWAIDARGWAAR